MEEEWKPILEMEGRYEVSNWGRLRSKSRLVNARIGKRRLNGRILKTFIDGAGYDTFKVLLNGKFVGRRIHRMVAIHFLGVHPEFKTVNHKDLNKRNNHVSNLEWLSLADNIRHGFANGRYDGTNNPNRANKLTAEKVREIRKSIANGIARKDLAKEFCVSQAIIFKIVHNQAWKQA